MKRLLFLGFALALFSVSPVFVSAETVTRYGTAADCKQNVQAKGTFQYPSGIAMDDAGNPELQLKVDPDFNAKMKAERHTPDLPITPVYDLVVEAIPSFSSCYTDTPEKFSAEPPKTLPFRVSIVAGNQVIVDRGVLRHSDRTDAGGRMLYEWRIKGWPNGIATTEKLEQLIAFIASGQSPSVLLQISKKDGSTDNAKGGASMGLCAPIWGSGRHAVAFSRTKDVTVPEFVNRAVFEDIPKGFHAIEPYASEKDAFSHTLDLTKHDDRPLFDFLSLQFQDPASVIQRLNDAFKTVLSSPCGSSLGILYAKFPYDKNSPKGKQTLGVSATIPLGSIVSITATPAVTMHEFSHTFAGLNDEYVWETKTIKVGGTLQSNMPGVVYRNCSFNPHTDYDHGGTPYGASTIVGCNKFSRLAFGDGSQVTFYRPSSDSLMRTTKNGNKLNVVSCGYVMAAINDEPTDKAHAEKYWDDCAKLDTVKTANSERAPFNNLASIFSGLFGRTQFANVHDAPDGDISAESLGTLDIETFDEEGNITGGIFATSSPATTTPSFGFSTTTLASTQALGTTTTATTTPSLWQRIKSAVQKAVAGLTGSSKTPPHEAVSTPVLLSSFEHASGETSVETGPDTLPVPKMTRKSLPVSGSPLAASCFGEVKAKNEVEWGTRAFGGDGNYVFKWSGTDGLSGSQPAIKKQYQTGGFKRAQVIISSGGESTKCDTAPVELADDSPVPSVSELEAKGVFIIEVDSKDASAYDLSKAFYKKYNRDDWDFLALYSQYSDTVGGGLPLLHYMVKNDVKGIGLPLFDWTASFGSQGRLIGVGMLWNPAMYKDFPYNALLEETFAHSFGMFVGDSEKLPVANPLNMAHWNSCMSFPKNSNAQYDYWKANTWHANGDGTWTLEDFHPFAPERLDPFMLYLAGFLPPEKVPDATLLIPQSGDQSECSRESTIRATSRKISIQDIIALQGPRVPSVMESKKQFNTAFVLAVLKGTTPSDQVLKRLAVWAEKWPGVLEDAVTFSPGQNGDEQKVRLAANEHDGPLTVSFGDKVTLSWTLPSAAAACSGNWTQDAIDTKNKTGIAMVSPRFPSTLYTLACTYTDASGKTVGTDSVEVRTEDYTGQAPVQPTLPPKLGPDGKPLPVRKSLFEGGGSGAEPPALVIPCAPVPSAPAAPPAAGGLSFSDGPATFNYPLIEHGNDFGEGSAESLVFRIENAAGPALLARGSSPHLAWTSWDGAYICYLNGVYVRTNGSAVGAPIATACSYMLSCSDANGETKASRSVTAVMK